MKKCAPAVLGVLLAAIIACSRDPEAVKQNLLQTGHKYAEAGKLKEASLLYRRAIQKDRLFAEAYHHLGLVELRLGRIPEAAAALDRATELNPANEDAFTRLADVYLAVYFANRAKGKDTLDKILQLTARAGKHIPESPDLLRIKGFLALSDKNYKGALRNFGAALERKPDDGRLALGYVESLTAEGRFEEAATFAASFIDRNRSFPGMYDFLYLRYSEQQKVQEAVSVLEEKCRRNPRETSYWLQLAFHYHAAGNDAKKAEVIERILKLPREHHNPYAGAGDFFMQVGQFEQALDTYRKGAAAEPERKLEFHKKMVEALAFQNRTPEATQLVQEILAEQPKDSQALAMRGALRLRGGSKNDIQAALADFESALSAMPENAVLRFNLAEAYVIAGDLDRAIVEYLEAIRRRPDYIQPRYGLAQVHLDKREFAKAQGVAEEVLALKPGDLRAKLIRANAWLNLGKRDLARTDLEEVLAKVPNAAEPAYLLATLHFLNKDLGKAEVLYKKLTAKDPLDRRGVLGLVEIELAKNRADSALRLVQQCIDKRPNDIEWRRAMGNVAARTRQHDRAAREFGALLAAHPNDGPAHRDLAHVYREQGKLQDAATHFERAAQLMPEDSASFLQLAITLEAQGRLPDAIAYYEKTIELTPDNYIALNNLAYGLAETAGDLDRALALVQRAKRTAPTSPDVSDTLGWVYVKKQLNDSAISVLTELVSKHPDNASWRYHLAVAYFQKGDLQRAKSELERALRGKLTPKEGGHVRELLAKVAG